MRNVDTEAAAAVQDGTTLLRKSGRPLHRRLRGLLEERGIDPGTSLLATFMPEGRTYASGAVVADTGRIYEFEFSFPLQRYETAWFSLWREVTESYPSRTFAPDVDAALLLLRPGGRRDSTS